jgi:glycerophosphoryl diester phosphodiesterase
MKTDTKKIEVHGHRGARSIYPENSLPAFSYALSTGVDVLEMDLGVTKDNVLVIYHDQVINPVICKYKNGKKVPKDLALHSLTLKQVKEFDCGSLQNPRFLKQTLVPGTEIPTFDELLNWLKTAPGSNAQTVRFNIETKSELAYPKRQPEPKKFAQLVYDALKKHDIVNRSVVQSFDFRTILAMKEIAPEVTTVALIEERPEADLVKIVQDSKASIVSPHHEWLTKEDVAAFHGANIKVVPWTLNDEASWQRALDNGVDGIITDDPAALMEFLKK